jgi:hypothetical protein
MENNSTKLNGMNATGTEQHSFGGLIESNTGT